MPTKVGPRLARRREGPPLDHIARQVEHHVPLQQALLAQRHQDTGDALLLSLPRLLGLG
jgi:hypothetical protein